MDDWEIRSEEIYNEDGPSWFLNYYARTDRRIKENPREAKNRDSNLRKSDRSTDEAVSECGHRKD